MLIFALASLLTGCIDQLTKLLAMARLTPEAPVPLWGFLQLSLTHNRGAAFGLLPGGWLPVSATIAVCVVVCAYACAGGLHRAPARSLPLGLIVGGALGNLVDRLRFGAVVDFVDLQIWPVFNVADAAITVGILVLAAEMLRRR